MKIAFLPPARAGLADAISYYNIQSEGECNIIKIRTIEMSLEIEEKQAP